MPNPVTGTDPAPALRVHYVDVGQGDGVIWQLPDGSFAVYDCGDAAGSAADNPMVARLRLLGLQPGGTIHALIASHGHLDHVGGCEEVLQEYRVEHLYEAWYDGADAPRSYERFRDQLKAEGGTIHTLAPTPALDGELTFQAGAQVAFPGPANTARVRADIMWPPAFQGHDWDAIAQSSIAVRLTYGRVSFCFQGDIAVREENLLAASGDDLRCDVYLAGHHGSRYASSSAWLAKMQPAYAVVSVGANSYGHPTSDAFCRMQQAAAKVLVTHRLGTIEVATDGASLRVTPELPEDADYCQPGAAYWAAPG